MFRYNDATGTEIFNTQGHHSVKAETIILNVQTFTFLLTIMQLDQLPVITED